MDILEAVDIVYLWVDGSDPDWRRKRQSARQSLDARQGRAMALYGNVEGRFRDNDELRCSLRALERFFPQHGHVYIVTDGQTPPWMAAHPQLTIVDHRELIPACALPTFDSCHIESYIHRIPQLSERYFYFNDDVFFGAPVHLSDWFWEGGVYAAWSDEPDVRPGPLHKESDALHNACRQSIQWLDQHPQAEMQASYQHTFKTFAHAPRPMCKSVLLQLEHTAPELFASVRSTVFRTWDKPTIVSDFVMRWSLANGLARMRDYDYVYVATGETHQASGIARVIKDFGDLHFFCINDTLDNAPDNDPRLWQMREALQGLFVTASRYERPASMAAPHQVARRLAAVG
jgi:Stealth protein CR2, conserved region 2/Stealth protein CR1, conserved region 1